jgi:hypothetical protein
LKRRAGELPFLPTGVNRGTGPQHERDKIDMKTVVIFGGPGLSERIFRNSFWATVGFRTLAKRTGRPITWAAVPTISLTWPNVTFAQSNQNGGGTINITLPDPLGGQIHC